MFQTTDVANGNGQAVQKNPGVVSSVPATVVATRGVLPSPPGQPACGRRTILVVDDDRGTRELVREILTRQGHEVVSAEDGPQGLTLFERSGGSIDSVILDLSLPGMSGAEVLSVLLQRAPTTRVILSSGHAPGTFEVAGHRAFLRKPYTIAQLRQTVADVLAMPA
jgi:CheY-like chemotaxis protein